MILAESALSFLNLGLRPPLISWGVLLQEAQNLETIRHFPWLLIPGCRHRHRRAGFQLLWRRPARRRRPILDVGGAE